MTRQISSFLRDGLDGPEVLRQPRIHEVRTRHPEVARVAPRCAPRVARTVGERPAAERGVPADENRVTAEHPAVGHRHDAVVTDLAKRVVHREADGEWYAGREHVPHGAARHASVADSLSLKRLDVCSARRTCGERAEI